MFGCDDDDDDEIKSNRLLGEIHFVLCRENRNVAICRSLLEHAPSKRSKIEGQVKENIA
jgi:hypothetical protein